MLNVIDPLDGIVTHVGGNIITVYVSPTDSHTIYAPVSESIAQFATQTGVWKRRGVFNVPDQTKTGRLSIVFGDGDVTLWD